MIYVMYHDQNHDGKWLVSLRKANPGSEIDVSLIAWNHGGGGHEAASGFIYEGDINKLLIHGPVAQ